MKWFVVSFSIIVNNMLLDNVVNLVIVVLWLLVFKISAAWG